MLNSEQKMQKILRYTYDIVLFTINKYYTCFETVNLEQTLTVHDFTFQITLFSTLADIFAV